MKIVRIYNNNVVMSVDENDNEKMLLGRGIGFNHQVGDDIDDTKVDKIFLLESQYQMSELATLVQHIPANYLELTKIIVEQAEVILDVNFHDSIFIGLTDHISYALERTRENDVIKNALLWEVKKFYRKEFQAAMKILDIIEEVEHVRLSEDEASFIAMHFVNGQQGSGAMKMTVIATEVIQDILNIIKFHFKINLNEDSINYSRFVVHIRFLLQRAHDMSNEIGDDELFLQVSHKYPETYHCAMRIKRYLDSKMDMFTNSEELLYLMLHINRLTNRELYEHKIGL